MRFLANLLHRMRLGSRQLRFLKNHIIKNNTPNLGFLANDQKAFLTTLPIYDMNRKYPIELKKQAIKLAESGKTKREIADILSISYYTIHKMVYGHCVSRQHSQEQREKARVLIDKGISKSRVAYELGIPLGTMAHWNIPSPNPPKSYGKEVRERAERMVLSGLSISETAKELGISIKTIRGWVGTVKITSHPKSLVLKARQLAGRGLDKTYLAKRYKLSYQTVSRWSNDIVNKKSRVAGRYFMVMIEVINKGYFITRRNDLIPLRFLSRYANLRLKLIGRFAVCYLKGSENKAFDALIKEGKIGSLTARKLNLIKEAFNIKR